MNRGPERRYFDYPDKKSTLPEKAVMALALTAIGTIYAAEGDNVSEQIRNTFRGDPVLSKEDTVRMIVERAIAEGRTIKVKITASEEFVNFRQEPVIPVERAGYKNVLCRIEAADAENLNFVLFRAAGYPEVNELWGATVYKGMDGFVRADSLIKAEDGSPLVVDGDFSGDIYDYETGKLAIWDIKQ